MNGRTSKQLRRKAIMFAKDMYQKTEGKQKFSIEPKYKRNSKTGQIVLFACTKMLVQALKKQRQEKLHFTPVTYAPSNFSRTIKIWQSGKNKKSKRDK